MENKLKKTRRLRKKMHIRKKIFGTSEVPRISVFKSNKYFYAQVIDDQKGTTIASATSQNNKELVSSGNIIAAKCVATQLAEKLAKKRIKSIVFDRNGYIYHGRVQAFADTLRKSGIEF